MTLTGLDAIVEKHSKELLSIYKDVGYNDTEIEKRYILFLGSVDAACASQVNNAKSSCEELRLKCESDCQELQKVIEQLSDVSITVKVPEIEPPYLLLQERVATQRRQLESIYNDRKKDRDGLVAKCRDLCVLIGENEPELVHSPQDLSQNTIALLIQEKSRLEDLKRQRQEKVAAHLARIKNLEEELGDSTLSQLYNSFGNDALLSVEKLSQLVNHEQELESAVTERREKIEKYRAQCAYIWGLLDYSRGYISEFGQKHSGLSMHVYEAYKKEVTRLETEKKANLEKFISAQNEKRLEMCTALFLSESETAFEVECSEEGLASLEREVERLQALYTAMEPVLSAVKDLKDLLNDEARLEEASKDPSRYKGGSRVLLLEEKTRNRVKKMKPVVVDKLKKLLDEYEENGAPFLVDGVPFRDTVEKVEQSMVPHKRRRVLSEVPKNTLSSDSRSADSLSADSRKVSGARKVSSARRVSSGSNTSEVSLKPSQAPKELKRPRAESPRRAQSPRKGEPLRRATPRLVGGPRTIAKLPSGPRIKVTQGTHKPVRLLELGSAHQVRRTTSSPAQLAAPPTKLTGEKRLEEWRRREIEKLRMQPPEY